MYQFNINDKIENAFLFEIVKSFFFRTTERCCESEHCFKGEMDTDIEAIDGRWISFDDLMTYGGLDVCIGDPRVADFCRSSIPTTPDFLKVSPDFKTQKWKHSSVILKVMRNHS